MPKRTNPFGSDYSPLQMKIHVTQREVNMGVNKEKNMKSVYDHTRELLYGGQKARCAQEQEVEMADTTPMEAATNFVPVSSASPVKAPSPPSWFHNQLQLTTGGQLVYGKYPDVKESSQARGKVMCASCRNAHKPVHYVCAFCESNLCMECRQTCFNCEGGFCTRCCTINYDERCDRVFCLNCAY
ncbi:apoptosis regulatory protein Siva-like [Diadema setosum]|uniref:apoptosis regulatory protein Siva-like n=1 Tax=Diadema antillarum TaxID=105358 RepID=UPI003A898B94